MTTTSTTGITTTIDTSKAKHPGSQGRNRDTINAETARATRLPGRTWPLRAAAVGLRLADVTEMPTLREHRHLANARQ